MVNNDKYTKSFNYNQNRITRVHADFNMISSSIKGFNEALHNAHHVINIQLVRVLKIPQQQPKHISNPLSSSKRFKGDI